ncbi:MAG: hypothetical protein GQ570_01115 [Helicobacteraceae bacterium]|nr:hypothetical protein [Helicobacteraceae bacterium]
MRNILITLLVTIGVLFSGCISSSSKVKSGQKNAPLDRDVSAYLQATYTDVDSVKESLTKAKFEVLATYKNKAFKKGSVLIFTNEYLKKVASKDKRGFAGVLRILVDEERKVLSITNPVYFHKAFLQDEYNYDEAVAINKSLASVLGKLKETKDKLGFSELSGYQYMISMPYYKDVEVVGKGDTATLLKKAREYKKGKELVFELKLAEDKYLLGYKIGKRTSKFIKKIGTQHSEVLPYTISIENGEAKIMAPKYYLAISYPLLTLGEFMTIATVPSAIEKDLKKPFK